MKLKEIMPTEEQDQIALAQLLDRIKYGTRNLRWAHIPNGGSRNVIEAVKLKRMGVKKGLLDIFIFDAAPNVIFKNDKGSIIEMKRKKGGKLSDEQKDWIYYFKNHGWEVAVCNGLDEALQQLRSWGYLRD